MDGIGRRGVIKGVGLALSAAPLGLFAPRVARAQSDGVTVSDEAGLVERLGHDVHVVLGSERNIKITKPANMELARFFLERERAKA